MIDSLGGVTMALVNVALDAALIRHEVIANNIANYDTPDFRAKQLQFESYLAGITQVIQGSPSSVSGDARLAAAEHAVHTPETLIVETDEPVELDREIVRLTENTLRYHALLKAAGKRGEILRTAISGGGR